MELNILTRCDMQDVLGVFFGQLGEDVALVGRDAAERDLDPLHAGCVPDGADTFRQAILVSEFLCVDAIEALAIVVTLAIDAPSQTRFSEELVGDLVLPFKLHLRFVDVDLFSEVGRDAAAQLFFPGLTHGRPPVWVGDMGMRPSITSDR